MISVPPWDKSLNHEQARAEIVKWAAEHPEWFPPAEKAFVDGRPPFIKGKECYIPTARGNAFAALLTEEQAASLRHAEHLKKQRPKVDIKGRGRGKGRDEANEAKRYAERTIFLVTPILKWSPMPIVEDAEPGGDNGSGSGTGKGKGAAKARAPAPPPNSGPVTDPAVDPSTARLGTTATNIQTARAIWAAADIVSTGTWPSPWTSTTPLPTKLAITKLSTEAPVLYVVDTGLQPFVGTTPATIAWHQEFSSAAGTTPKLKFRQGKTSGALGASWPPPAIPANPNGGDSNPSYSPPVVAPWAKEEHEVMTFTTLTKCPNNLGSPYNMPPYHDISSTAHGTKITSTAIGTWTGVLNRMTVNGDAPPIEVEPIRIYDNAQNSDSVAVYEGILLALAAHEKRRTALGYNPPSVLLFASRSDVSNGGMGFDDQVEAALWWAWHQGMICVVSGGNEAAGTNAAAPCALWYPLSTNAIYSSPARFDWSIGNSVNGLGWPNWPFIPANPGEEDPRPENVYMILVGGSNRAFNTTSLAVTLGEGWRTGSSRGPDIDLIAPSTSVPCASLTVTNYPSNADCIATATGSSLTTGHVAGVALAYLLTKQNPSGTAPPIDTPANFRNWLLTANAPSATTPCKTTTGATAWNPTTGRKSPYASGEPLFNWYNGFVPKLKLQSGIAW